MLYVHNVYLDHIERRSEAEVMAFAAGFNPIVDDD
jgi:hypothetical protein